MTTPTEVRVVPNPEFEVILDRQLLMAVEDAARFGVSRARAHARFSQSIPPAITVVASGIDHEGPHVSVGLKRSGFKGQFFEGGTKERFATKRKGKPLTKPAFRGSVDARPFMKPARDETERRGLKVRL